MPSKFITIAAIAALAAAVPGMAQTADTEDAMALSESEVREARTILEGMVEDYRRDHMAIDSTFGIKLDDRFWTVQVQRTETPKARRRLTDHSFGPHLVTLTDGEPTKPTWYFEIADMNVLRLIASGQVNAGTAAMQSFDSDQVGLETRDMEGFKSTPGDQAELYLVLSHFFTRGKPEVTRFGRDNSLETHGAQATALHFMKGFRILHVSLGPQQTANEDPRLQFGQMPNLFVITNGTGTLHTDDGPMKLEPGMSVFVPPFVKHEMVNDGDEPLEGFLVLYGDNSDFAFGTSYPTFQQDLNEFYRTYEFRKPQPAEDAE